MAWSRLLTFALLAVAAGGCGSSSTSLAPADAARLHRDVASIRSAANGQKRAAVRTLVADITQLRAANRIAPADASVLLTDAGQVDRKVPKAVSAPASPSAAPAPGPGQAHGPQPPAHGPQPPGPQPPDKGKAKANGKGHGDGNGGGGGDGGD